ncbi:MAG: DegV family protein [Anaerolineae bacterium]|nr:DegV family protein [Anaerolineae bacterium]
MHVVSDRGMDLSAQQMAGLDIHLAPLTINLDGKTYVSGVDIQPDEFYELLASAEGMPTTSLPSPGDFAQLFRKLAKTDPEILFVHISSGLSSTFNSAREGAKLVPEAIVHFFDTMTLSGAQGWQVEAAARAALAGWPVDKIIALLKRVREITETVFTLPDLKYLIHGGRISHLSGLLASVLQIKPLIGVSKEDGKYYERAKARTFKRAVAALVDVTAEDCPAGSPLRVQVMHANNSEGAGWLRDLLDKRFKCSWLPIGSIAPVLGAHTGPGLVGLAYAPLNAYPELP